MSIDNSGAAKKQIPLPAKLPRCPYASKPPSPSDYGHIVNVVVGSDASKRTFPVHEGLLKHYSTYFTSALKREWSGENPRSLELPADDPKVFGAFSHWLSTNTLYPMLTTEGRIPLSFSIICKIYIFGDCRGAPKLCNAAIDLLFQKIGQAWKWPAYQLHTIYDNTVEDAPLRKFIVDVAAEHCTFDDIRNDREEYPHDFLIDMLRKIAGSRKLLLVRGARTVDDYVTWKKSEICGTYHDHSLKDAPTESKDLMVWDMPRSLRIDEGEES